MAPDYTVISQATFLFCFTAKNNIGFVALKRKLYLDANMILIVFLFCA